MADMETNVAYGVHGNTPAVENNTYELVEMISAPEKGCSRNQMEMKKEKIEYCFKIFITTIAVTALLLVLIFLSFFSVHYISDRSLGTQQSEVIGNLLSLLNTSNEQLYLQRSELKEAQRFIQSLQLQLNNSNEQLNQTVELQESLQRDFYDFREKQQTSELLNQNHIQEITQELNNTVNLIEQIILPTHSCRDLPQGSLSGYYYVKTYNGYNQIYCDINLRTCSCDGTTRWMRVANLDMTDPTQQCPDRFKLIHRTEPPLRTCGRRDGISECVSTTFKTQGVEYSRVCGRIVGYQIGSPSGFGYQSVGIDSYYVSGISLTHGQPRQHIYTFANAQGEGYTSEVCPCIQGGTDTVPQFVGSDYFCDSAVRGSNASVGVFYSYDPLWDGQGCGSTSTCCEFNNPPWFCKQLPQPTTDDIELRLCENGPPNHDESPFEIVELYIS